MKRCQHTGGLIPIGAKSDVVLDLSCFGPCYFLHLLDLRMAEFGVVVEKHAALLDGQVVFGPVPEVTQVLIIQCIK